ncbi:MAG: hypothetical protein HZR80_16135 [Candidatus Heimdallarchaeota archaeon]
MNDNEKAKPRIAIITLIQEGAVKVGGEHAMLFPYVEQILKAAETSKEKLEIIPYVVSPRPKKLEKLARVEELKEKMNNTYGGQMILVSNGATGPYTNPWNWEKYGHEANKAILKLAKEKQLDGIIIMAHGFASIPGVLNLITSKENGLLGDIPVSCYYITHSSFDEHKDNRPQRRILEREIQNHAKMIAISPYMSNHLEEIGLVKSSNDTIPLYNALPEKGWFSSKVSKELTLEMLNERNSKVNQGPFFGVELPIEDILEGRKELVLYFGRAQKYVKGTDAVIACAKSDSKRHYMLICSGSQDELTWHKRLIKDTDNITMAWEHNSKLVLGVVQLTEDNPKARIYSLFLSRREPMGLVSREVVLMQDNGSVLPLVSDKCGFEDQWQKEFSFVVANPSSYEDDLTKQKSNSQLAKGNDIFIHDDCIRDTLDALDKLSNLTINELRKRVLGYKEAVKINYSQNRYWSFYLDAVGVNAPNIETYIENIIKKNNLEKIPNV